MLDDPKAFIMSLNQDPHHTMITVLQQALDWDGDNYRSLCKAALKGHTSPEAEAMKETLAKLTTDETHNIDAADARAVRALHDVIYVALLSNPDYKLNQPQMDIARIAIYQTNNMETIKMPDESQIIKTWIRGNLFISLLIGDKKLFENNQTMNNIDSQTDKLINTLITLYTKR